ncbi:WXG100 family type VII secretion target [Nocardia sp. NPDC051570]|uniref:WXG100 family type VII secretion target n=1 Tax=Nocardia sp. NPDC051570 TaxID=3364324 RepID=UPI0037B984FB
MPFGGRRPEMVGVGDNSFGNPSGGAGDEAIEVDPGDLHIIGHQFTTAASDAVEHFARYHTDLEDYSSTVFTTTRAALMDKVDGWRARTTRLLHTVDSHGRELHSSAIEYRAADGNAQTDIENVVGQA